MKGIFNAYHNLTFIDAMVRYDITQIAPTKRCYIFVAEMVGFHYLKKKNYYASTKS